MYHSIRGKLAGHDDSTVFIDTGGVSYEIAVPLTVVRDLPTEGQEILLFTRLILRENEMYLVGFLSPDDRRLYDSLVTVSGIGPKQALKILSDLNAGLIRNAILSGDVTALSAVKGIGAKTASRIVLELKDKMKKLADGAESVPGSGQERKKLEVLMAMRVLGYNDTEVKGIIDKVFADPVISAKEVEDIIKSVLSGMAR